MVEEAQTHDGPTSVQPLQIWKGFYELRLEPGLVQAQPVLPPCLVPLLNRKEFQLRISLIICSLPNSMEICVNQKQNQVWIPRDCAKQAHEPLHGPKGDFWTMIKRARQTPIPTIILLGKISKSLNLSREILSIKITI